MARCYNAQGFYCTERGEQRSFHLHSLDIAAFHLTSTRQQRLQCHNTRMSLRVATAAVPGILG
jgi:hypothetical protein